VTTSRLRWILAAVCIGTMALAVATYWTGPLTISIGDSRLFRNSSSLRPLVVAAVMLVLLGQLRGAVRVLSVGILVLLLPVQTASGTVTRALVMDYPLRATQECMSELTERDADLRRGFYVSDPFVPELAVHPLFYSFRHLGPWLEGMASFDDEVRGRLADPLRHAPLLLSPEQWRAVQTTSSMAEAAVGLEGVQVAPGVVVVLPGPYRSCVPAVVSAGGRIVEGPAPE
jgi:hypothetical protein